MATEIRTEHPHVVITPDVCGGRPRIARTRIAIDFIARFLHSGIGATEILEMYPHLTPAAVHDAISYYYDHQPEVDASIKGNTLEQLASKYDFEVGEDGVVVFGEL
ncbi:MAG: DUF433 domain-containing protein [Dehalococcoidia bacterium]